MEYHAGTERGGPGDAAARPCVAALVVFADSSELKYLRCLRRGFRHCFVAIRREERWVLCDPLSNQTALGIVDGLTSDELAAWYRQHGMVVIETDVRPPPPRPAPLRPFTCVEAVKRILGVHAPWVLTPWQLYRLLAPGEKTEAMPAMVRRR
jgi:hypothetical protein